MSYSVKQVLFSVKQSRFLFQSLIVGLLLFISAQATAQGDLLISPLRVTFEGNKKSQEINLANVGKDTATFAVSVVDYRMNGDGSFEQITVPDSGQNFAGPYIRFFPRKVTLAPNEAQVVKLQVVKTAQMANGEYRSHLYFRAVPDEKPLGETPKQDTSGISISLKPIFGITIPVIIRVGENDANVTLSDLSFTLSGDTAKLTMNLNRTGMMSVYGDLKVDYVSPSGKKTQVKIVKGVGVYTPIPVRRFSMELDADKKADYRKGKLHVTYTLQTSDKSEKKAEAEIELK